MFVSLILERTRLMHAKLIGLGLLTAVLGILGCSDQPANTPTTTGDKGAASNAGKKEAHAPHGEGPNGGVIFDLGKYHVEFTVDHPAKECTVLFISGENKDAKPLPVAAKEFSLAIKETKVKEGADKGKVVPPMTIALKPADAKDGKASKFVGTDTGIGNVADFEGTVIGEIDGKPSQGTFKE